MAIMEATEELKISILRFQNKNSSRPNAGERERDWANPEVRELVTDKLLQVSFHKGDQGYQGYQG